ncbi:hypothetical protein [uncultured Clostridium sp.]|uniref:hypothetical protein n=1 Tax=uncultured Clostridium sp. TaxID=59620 RepID=UPI0026175BF7|nr:hypothetical protein [uncultured Clostridium sp.]
MTMESWILILGLLAMVVFRQMGERKFTIRSTIIQIVLVGYFTYKYVDGVPTGGSNTVILVGMTVAGLILGAFMLLATKTYLKDGQRFVKSGITYLVLWIIGLGSKVVLAEYMTKWNVKGTVEFIMKHHINPNVITTSFMFFTIGMIVVRTVGVYIRFGMLEKNKEFKAVRA